MCLLLLVVTGIYPGVCRTLARLPVVRVAVRHVVGVVVSIHIVYGHVAQYHLNSKDFPLAGKGVNHDFLARRIAKIQNSSSSSSSTRHRSATHSSSRRRRIPEEPKHRHEISEMFDRMTNAELVQFIRDHDMSMDRFSGGRSKSKLVLHIAEWADRRENNYGQGADDWLKRRQAGGGSSASRSGIRADWTDHR